MKLTFVVEAVSRSVACCARGNCPGLPPVLSYATGHKLSLYCCFLCLFYSLCCRQIRPVARLHYFIEKTISAKFTWLYKTKHKCNTVIKSPARQALGYPGLTACQLERLLWTYDNSKFQTIKNLPNGLYKI